MEESKLWIEKAKDDLDWTGHNIESGVFYGACFTAHQSIEKSLKAFVISKTGTLRKMHDVRALLEDCITIDPSFEGLREKVLTVLPYYIETRYPMYEELVVFTKEMAEEAYEYAQDIYTFVNGKINI